MCRIKFLILNILLLCLLISQINSQGIPDIPRHEVLIVDNHKGRIIDPYDFNYWKPGNIEEGGGLHQLLLDVLWYLDPQTGKVINSLVESSPSYDKDIKN
jgi:peptide/nickel transport system substrate-binding protein